MINELVADVWIYHRNVQYLEWHASENERRAREGGERQRDLRKLTCAYVRPPGWRLAAKYAFTGKGRQLALALLYERRSALPPPPRLGEREKIEDEDLCTRDGP